MRKYIYFIFFIVCLGSCNSEPSAPSTITTSDETYQRIAGKTMGTTYNITHSGKNQGPLKNSIDSLLVAINLEVSTYIDSSTISQFNQAEQKLDINISKKHFLSNFEQAKEIFEKTEGAFDPTVMPLVNYWGFGYTPKRKVTKADTLKIQDLVQLVGMKKVQLHKEGKKDAFSLEKNSPSTQLDFSAIAKGYGVDAIGEYLEEKDIENYFVEIGGETKVKGNNPNSMPWRIGINLPESNSTTTEIYSVVELTNQAIATSGNYRNYHEVNGKKYGHTINPKTGFPEMNTTLSASVIAENCMTADAYATAFMTMGYKKALELAETIPNLETYLIFANEKGEMETVMSSGMKEFLK